MNTLQQIIRLLGLGTEITGEKVTLSSGSYTLAKNPVPGTEKVYYAGLRFSNGIEYTITVDTAGKATLVFVAPFPVNPDDIIVVDYRSF
jgi:hypothetical protein